MLTDVDVASRYKVPKALRTKKVSEAVFVLDAKWKKLVCLNTQSYFIVIIGLSLNVIWQSCLKNTMLIFEDQLQNTSIPTKFFGSH